VMPSELTCTAAQRPLDARAIAQARPSPAPTHCLRFRTAASEVGVLETHQLVRIRSRRNQAGLPETDRRPPDVGVMSGTGGCALDIPLREAVIGESPLGEYPGTVVRSQKPPTRARDGQFLGIPGGRRPAVPSPARRSLVWLAASAGGRMLA